MSARDFFGVPTDYTVYRATIQVLDQIAGGVPSDPSVTKKWLEAKLELDETALDELLAATIAERDAPLSAKEKIDALMATPDAPSVNGFKRNIDTGELAWEGRCAKAALKEWMNSAYPGVKFPGKTKMTDGAIRKGLMRVAAEYVFVDPLLIGLGVKQPDVTEERIKHVMTPQGPRSAINRVEVVHQPQLVFDVSVRDDFLPKEAWARIWQVGERIGIGSDRARGDGQFELISFEKH
jgi:hypothetical protein